MTVASEIARIKTNISNAYDSAEAKGATLPEQKNSENLAECINSITGGSEQTTCAFRVPDNVTEISTSSTFMNLYGNVFPFPYDIAVDFNNVEVVSGENCFYTSFGGCKLVSLKEKIKTISGKNAFNSCFALVDIPEDWTIFENLENIGERGLAYCFTYCQCKQTYRFKKLKVIADRGLEGCFAASDAVRDIYFDSVTENSFLDGQSSYKYHLADLLSGNTTGCTLHFPSNLSNVIPTLLGYPNFSGTNTVILYDLPATG